MRRKLSRCTTTMCNTRDMTSHHKQHPMIDIWKMSPCAVHTAPVRRGRSHSGVAVPHRTAAGVRFAEVMELSTQPVGPGPAERVLRPGEGIAFDISDKW